MVEATYANVLFREVVVQVVDLDLGSFSLATRMSAKLHYMESMEQHTPEARRDGVSARVHGGDLQRLVHWSVDPNGCRITVVFESIMNPFAISN